MTNWVDRRAVPPLRRVKHRLSDDAAYWVAFAIGALAGAASLLIYRSNGYSRTMLWLWLLGLAGLSVFFWSRNRALPRVTRRDFLAPLGLMAVFSPLYLLALYRWPVQVSGDEVAIVDVAEDYAQPQGVDPFGLSYYLSRPVLLFLAWGKLGELFGGFDLYHMRLLHAVFGLLTIAATYALLRQLLPRSWAIFASAVLGSSHAFLMISRLAMRENTAVLVAVVGFALLLWGLRNEHALATFLGGVVAGLGFYVYFPARVTMPIWLAFLVLLGLTSRRTFPVRRLVLAGSIALAGFLLMATPITIAESKIQSVPGPSDSEPQRETLMIYADAREKQRQWVFAPTVWEGYKKNVDWGLGTFNNKVADEGFIYRNAGHGFVDPLTGILLWLGVGLLLVRLVRRRADEGVLLAVSGFLILWLSFAFVVNKAPNYTRLLVTLPFVAYLVTQAVRWLAGRWQSVPRASAVITAGALTALVCWNLAIAWDFVQDGRRDGEVIGSTGRYVTAHSDRPNQKFFITAPGGGWDYYSYGHSIAYENRLKMFAARDEQVPPAVDLNSLGAFASQAPFALFLRREAYDQVAQQLIQRYPSGRVRNVIPSGTHVVFEVSGDRAESG
jgi:hypothetical protein